MVLASAWCASQAAALVGLRWSAPAGLRWLLVPMLFATGVSLTVLPTEILFRREAPGWSAAEAISTLVAAAVAFAAAAGPPRTSRAGLAAAATWLLLAGGLNAASPAAWLALLAATSAGLYLASR